MSDSPPYLFKQSIGQNDVLTSGNSIVYDKEDLVISFGDYSYRIVFVDGEKVDADIEFERDGLKFIIRNAVNPVGTVFGFPAGSFDGREAELRLAITGYVSSGQPVIRLVSYCLTVPKVVK